IRSRVSSLGRTAGRPRATCCATLRMAALRSRTPIWPVRWIIGTRFAKRTAPSRSSPAPSEGLEPEVDMGTRLLVLLPLLAGLPPHPATLPGNVVDIVAGDFYFRAPDTIPAGLTTLRLRVLQGGHIAVLVKLDSGYTASDLLRARREGHNRPAWVHFIGGPGFPPPGATANTTLVLAPGQYLLMCDVADEHGVRHFEKGMFRPLVVRAVAGAGVVALPHADVVVSERDYAFAFSAPLRAGQRVLRVVNEGAVMHEFRLVHVLPGHTGEESLRWKPQDNTPRPDEDVTAIVGLLPGGEVETTVSLVSGEYVALCVSQISHGMIQIVRVSP